MKYFLLVISVLSMGTTSLSQMRVEYEWKYFDLLWDSPKQRQDAIDSGTYDPKGAFLFDVDKALDGRVFITAVRDKGIPVSVLTVSDKHGESGPLLRPYPDWSWYKDDCKGITGGVYNLEIKCNHLFIVDGGRIGENQLCLPQLLIFDLSTDKLVKRVTVPIEIAHNKTRIGLIASNFVHLPNCRNVKNEAIVFMGDTEGAGLVVYNARNENLCRIESDFMKPTSWTIVVENQTYPFGDTMYGLTIIGDDLYYAALAGSKIYQVKYSKLIQCSEKDIAEANQQTKLVGDINGQTTMLTSDRCAIFFNDIAKASIMCADITKEITSQKVRYCSTLIISMLTFLFLLINLIFRSLLRTIQDSNF
ncbi:hypothetical protein PUN28_010168 [Cardiocondyla obscurior]|uniref:Bee-milk protein n=1 Tax=Cardiocondyla obscurior TaxID=286306 RepID=A0AAW2FNY7_9HYME